MGGVVAPNKPTRLRVTAGDGSVSVAFRAGSDGGSPITKYQYKLRGGSWTDAVGTSSPITISGLTNYTNYFLRLRAVNAVGVSPESELVVGRPRNTGPVLDSVTVTGSTSVRANFSGVLFGGVNGVRYTVSVYEAESTTVVGSCNAKPAARSCSVSGLNSDTDYDVRVTNTFRFPGNSILRVTLESNTVTVRTNPNP
jgi:hypothetical protein